MKIFSTFVERSIDVTVGYDLKHWSLPFAVVINLNIGYFGLHLGPLFFDVVAT